MDNNQAPNNELAELIASFQDEQKELRKTLSTLNRMVNEERDKQEMRYETIKTSIDAINDVIAKYNRESNFLDRKVEGLRSDTSSGIVLSIVIFTILFTISLFIRGD